MSAARDCPMDCSWSRRRRCVRRSDVGAVDADGCLRRRARRYGAPRAARSSLESTMFVIDSALFADRAPEVDLVEARLSLVGVTVIPPLCALTFPLKSTYAHLEPGPAGPVSPVLPCWPVSPRSPRSPFSPRGPVAPAGPAGPTGPSIPCGPSGPIGPRRPRGPRRTLCRVDAASTASCGVAACGAESSPPLTAPAMLTRPIPARMPTARVRTYRTTRLLPLRTAARA